MLSISVPMKGAGKGEYYLRLAQEDYYFNQGEPLGRWYGKGAERLGLAGRIDPILMRRLLDGFSPDGRRALVQNPGDPHRQSGWDLTFSAPKSVSVFWALGPDSVRRETEAIHEAALQKALDFLQEKAALTRRGKEGRRQERADFTFATFRHSTSRELDPQVHTHALLINVCVRKDGTTGTVWSKAFFKLKKKAGAVYAEALAHGFEQRFGLKVEPEKAGFHVLGVPRELCRWFSKRRQQIEEYLAQRKESGAIASKKAALKTRRKKVAVNRQELFTRWLREAEQFGWSRTQLEDLLARAQREKTEHAIKSNRAEAAPTTPPETGQAQASMAPGGTHEPPPSTARHTPRQQTQEASSSRGSQREATQNRGSQDKQEHQQSKQSKESKQSEQSKQSRQSRQSEQSQTSSSEAGTRKSGQKEKRNTKTRRRVRRRSKQNSRRGRQDFQHARAWSHVLWEKDFVVLRLRVQHKRFFPKAPSWNPAHKWGLPAVRVLTPRPAPVWAKVLWQKNVLGLQVRLQQKRLFREAPPWSPVSKLALPAFRLASASETAPPTKSKSKGDSHHH